MAVTLPGPLLSDIRGRVADVVFERNAGGLYVRSKGTVTQDPSDPREAASTALAYVSSDYRLYMSAAQRAAWSQYARNWPDVDRWGRTKVRTGQQAFCGMWFHFALAIAEPGPVDAPTTAPLPQTEITGHIDVATQFLHVDTPFPNWPTPAGNEYWWFYQGLPVYATRNYFSSPWRFCYPYLQVAPGWPAPFNVPLIFPVAAGQASWFRVYALQATPYREARRSTFKAIAV